MKTMVTSCFLFINSSIFAQEIVNIVLVGAKGVTEKIEDATSFILIKKYPDYYQRIDYIMHAPIQKVRTYKDSTLRILDGAYYEYASNGSIFKSGYYSSNEKSNDWYYYNDSGRVILQEKYEHDILITKIDPDTIKKTVPLKLLKDEDRQAIFKKGDSDWIKYLTKNLNADAGSQSVAGGEVRVMFIVNRDGKCIEVHLKKSVEFVLDQEAIRVVEQTPLWQPAVQDGKNVNAYRVQPLTFVKQ
jgi:TonB family protein